MVSFGFSFGCSPNTRVFYSYECILTSSTPKCVFQLAGLCVTAWGTGVGELVYNFHQL